MKSLADLSKDQKDLVEVLLYLNRPSSNKEIVAEYRRRHPIAEDPVRDRSARIRNVMQRNCETSKQFQRKERIFTNPERGIWWLTPDYARPVADWMMEAAE